MDIRKKIKWIFAKLSKWIFPKKIKQTSAKDAKLIPAKFPKVIFNIFGWARRARMLGPEGPNFAAEGCSPPQKLKKAGRRALDYHIIFIKRTYMNRHPFSREALLNTATHHHFPQDDTKMTTTWTVDLSPTSTLAARD